MSGRCRGVALVTAALLALAIGCGSPSDEAHDGHTDARQPTARKTTLLPTKPPAGFRLTNVELGPVDVRPKATNNYGGANAALYGDAGRDDPARGPLLLAHRAWGEDEAYLDLSTGCEPEQLRKTGVRSKHGPVQVCADAHADTYVVSWEVDPGDFTEELAGVLGRGVTPEQVARAADAVSVPKDGVGVVHEPLTIPDDALPAGLTRLTSGPVPAWTHGDTYVWEKADGSLTLQIADAYDGLPLLARVAVGGELRKIRGSLGAVGAGEVTWQEGDLLVGVTADGVDAATTEKFVRSLSVAPIDKALELKRAFLTRPAESFLDAGEKLALSGRTDRWRWVVAASADGRRTRGLLLSEAGEVGRFTNRPGSPGRARFVAEELEDFGYGRVVLVQVHADVAKVVLTTRPDRERIELTPGPAVLPDGSRYFGGWFGEQHKVGRVTSYDADGNQIAYQTSLAPYATPHVN